MTVQYLVLHAMFSHAPEWARDHYALIWRTALALGNWRLEFEEETCE